MAEDNIANNCNSPEQASLDTPTDEVHGRSESLTDSELMASSPASLEIDYIQHQCDADDEREKVEACERKWNPRSKFSEAKNLRLLKQQRDEGISAKAAAEDAKHSTEVKDTVAFSETEVEMCEGLNLDVVISPEGVKLASDLITQVDHKRAADVLTPKHFNIASDSSHLPAQPLEGSEETIHARAKSRKSLDTAYDSSDSEIESAISISGSKYTARLRATPSISDPEDFLRSSTDFVPTLTMVERRKGLKSNPLASNEENADEEGHLFEEPVMVEERGRSADNGVSEAQQYAMPLTDRLKVEVLVRVTSAMGIWHRAEPARRVRPKGSWRGWQSA